MPENSYKPPREGTAALMPSKRQSLKNPAAIRRANVNSTPAPTQEELSEHTIVRNGVELCLDKGPVPDNIALVAQLHRRFPGHLVLLQSGEFLHAYNHCAYFLHRLKSYRMQLIGSGTKAYLRVGFPVANSKRRLWKIVADFKVPYLVVLGSKAAGYKTFTSSAQLEQQSLLREIDSHIVARTIEELRQSNQVNHASTTRLLLNKDVSFRLKQVAQTLYQHLSSDVAVYPRNHRHGLGADMRESIRRILELVFDYALSTDRLSLLRQLSSTVDRAKFFITQAFELKLLGGSAFNHRVALVVELGSITGGLFAKMRALTSQETAVAYA